jgi:hypothetical protein
MLLAHSALHFTHTPLITHGAFHHRTMGELTSPRARALDAPRCRCRPQREHQSKADTDSWRLGKLLLHARPTRTRHPSSVSMLADSSCVSLSLLCVAAPNDT